MPKPIEQPSQAPDAIAAQQPAKKFVDLTPAAINAPAPATQSPLPTTATTAAGKPGPSVSHIDLSTYDEDAHADPYLEELLDVLNRVETQGEPYLEKLIVQAGLTFSTPSESELPAAVDKRDRKKLLSKKKTIKGKDSKIKVGFLEPASDDDYRKLYDTYKQGAGQFSPDESRSSRSSTSTESVADSLAEMIARGELPALEDLPSDEATSYGAKIIPYGSFEMNNKDAGLTKYAQSDAIIRAAHVAGASSIDELDEAQRERRKKSETDCVQESSEMISSVDFEEDLYDEGKSQEQLPIDEHGPKMVLLSSSEDEDELEPPPQYYDYTKQDSQCLAIVSNFRRQFTEAYPERKPLFLTPVNVGIARFFAYQMEYVLLNPPNVPPTVVMSPSFVLKERQGNCFDYCFILASVLIGVGYDTYVVNGYAAPTICTGDESHRICPLLPQDKEPEPIPDFEKEYDLSDFQSLLSEEVYKKTIKRQRDQRIKERNECVKGLDCLIRQEKARAGLPPHDGESTSEEEEVDHYPNQRVHAWIVVLPGKRDVTEPFFIDPFTGQAFATNHDEFLGIEAIWNHRQYYVNMQQTEPGEDLLWDLTDAQKWEAIFTGHVLTNSAKNPEDLRSDSDEMVAAETWDINDTSKGGDDQNCGLGWPFKGFEMPKPWSEPLTISKKRYLRYCKNGYRLHRFLKCDMEYYHPYERSDGLVSKFIIFQNRRKTRIVSVKEVYANRRDRLKYRKHIIGDGVIREYFSPGHIRGIKMHEVKIIAEKPPKFSELYKALNCFKMKDKMVRTFTYYNEYRNDCLKRLEQYPDEVCWFYEGRKDRLVRRRVRYGTQIDRSYAVEALKCKGEHRPIAMIAEKFDRNPGADPDLDMYMREFDVTGNKLFLVYQPEEGMVMSTQRRFHLPDFNEEPQSGSELPSGLMRMSEDVMTAIFRDQLKEEQRMPIDIWDEMVTNYRRSLEAILRVRRAEDDLKEEVNQRIEEEQEPALWHSTYDIEGHPRAAAILQKAQQATVVQQSARPKKAIFDPATFDWVAPYMAAYGDKVIASLDHALAIRQTVLEDLRERLLYTANALQKAHEEEFSRLQTLDEKFRRAQIGGQISLKDLNIYENEKASIQFKMHMLEHRQELLQFEGPAKLKRLNDWLLADPRFDKWLHGLELETRENIIEDELMTVKRKDHHWTPAQRKKVWKLESEDGDVVVEPLDGEKDELGAGHMKGGPRKDATYKKLTHGASSHKR
ncbi:Dynein regulatory complex subunit 7 [Hypsibius exemplaris]|uniref:Dynein regulatory complex subunit 7 n=1 Tax=Hypsibius exemplaris TaxID=2072580 RepID=A0A1W0X0A8_HYPEX|nr:Dynein regulatory complex subunit 7 [Hypsibius exemplaris]